MKHYYRVADAAIQLLLLLIWFSAFISKNEYTIQLYFVIGGWHVISLVVHSIISSKKFKQAYGIFAGVMIWLVAMLLIGFVFGGTLYAELILLLFIAPVLAALYTYSCIVEIIYLRKRPISYLK